MRLHLALCLLLPVLSACGGSSSGDTSGTPISTPSAQANEILRLVNEVRATGATCPTDASHPQATYPPVPRLVLEARLMAAAQAHSADMANRNYFAHNTPEGVTPQQRIVNQAGYSNWRTVGENIAGGYGTAQATMNAWMNSASHCPNIMNPQYRELGVGYAYNASSTLRDYWTQDFGARL